MNQNNNNTNRVPKQTYRSSNMFNITTSAYDDIVLPPNVEGKDKGVYDAIIKPKGQEKIFSVPEDTNKESTVLKHYLQNFCNQDVCVAFWNNRGGKFEKCGRLISVGSDYLSIKENRTKRIIIMNIDKIKYISVFCT